MSLTIKVEPAGIGYHWRVLDANGRTQIYKGFIPSGWERTAAKARKSATKARNHVLQLMKGETTA